VNDDYEQKRDANAASNTGSFVSWFKTHSYSH